MAPDTEQGSKPKPFTVNYLDWAEVEEYIESQYGAGFTSNLFKAMGKYGLEEGPFELIAEDYATEDVDVVEAVDALFEEFKEYVDDNGHLLFWMPVVFYV